jgi:hypothetical protein
MPPSNKLKSGSPLTNALKCGKPQTTMLNSKQVQPHAEIMNLKQI